MRAARRANDVLIHGNLAALSRADNVRFVNG